MTKCLRVTLCHVLIPIHIIYEGIGSKEQKFLHWTRLCLQRDDRHHVAISLPPQLCFGWGDVVVQQSDDNTPSYDLVGRRYEIQNCRHFLSMKLRFLPIYNININIYFNKNALFPQ